MAFSLGAHAELHGLKEEENDYSSFSLEIFYKVIGGGNDNNTVVLSTISQPPESNDEGSSSIRSNQITIYGNHC